MVRVGSFRPWVTNRPNRFSVQKLVAFSGSTSAAQARAECGGEITDVGDRVDAAEMRVERSEADPVERGGVEISGIIIGDLALVGAGRGIGAAGAGDDLGIAAVDDLTDHLEGAEAGPVGRDLRRRAPGAVGVDDRNRRPGRCCGRPRQDRRRARGPLWAQEPCWSRRLRPRRGAGRRQGRCGA